VAQVVETVDVNVPVSTAYNQWTQFETFPEFMSGVESITQTTPTRSHWVTKVAGVRREFDTEITEQQPDQRIAWKTVGGDVQHAGIVTFDTLSADASRVTVKLDWAPSGVAEKAGAAIGADDHRVKADTKRFKEFIEQRGAETGAWRGDVGGPADPTVR
jgi:uncharacterized membrane protein